MSKPSTRALGLAAAFALAAIGVASGQTCGDWSWANPKPQGNRLTGVAYGNGQFVAVGASGTVLTSLDGQTWTPRITRTRADLWALPRTAGQFVPVRHSRPAPPT